MHSSVHIDNKGKDILILGKEPTQRLDDTTLTAEAIYPTNYTQPNKWFLLSLHYNGSNSFLFVNATKNIWIQSKKLLNKRLCTVFSKISKNLQLII